MTLPVSKCSKPTQTGEPLEAVSEEYDHKWRKNASRKDYTELIKSTVECIRTLAW